jgi:hypothetical protein
MRWPDLVVIGRDGGAGTKTYTQRNRAGLQQHTGLQFTLYVLAMAEQDIQGSGY